MKALNENESATLEKNLKIIAKRLESIPLPNPDDLLSTPLLEILIQIISNPLCDASVRIPSLKIILFLTLSDNNSESLYTNDLIDLITQFIRQNLSFQPLKFLTNCSEMSKICFMILSNLLTPQLLIHLINNDIIGITVHSLFNSSSYNASESILHLIKKMIYISKTIPDFDFSSLSQLTEDISRFLIIQSNLQSAFCDVYYELINIPDCFQRALNCNIPNMLMANISAYSFVSFMKLINYFCFQGIVQVFDLDEFKNKIISFCCITDEIGLKQIAEFFEFCINFDLGYLSHELMGVVNSGNFQKKVVACEIFCNHFNDFLSALQMDITHEVVMVLMDIVCELPTENVLMCLRTIDFFFDNYPEDAKECGDKASFELDLELLNSFNNDEITEVANAINAKIMMMS